MTKKKGQQRQQETPPQLKTVKKEPAQVPRQPSVFFQQHKLPMVILIILAAVLYIQTIGFDYTLDDKMVITDNKFTQNGISGIGDIFKYESFRGYFGEQKNLLEGDRYRPLSIATFAIEKSIFNGSKVVSHLINIVLYALTAVLLMRVLLFFFPSFNEKNSENRSVFNQLWTIPFVATAIFMAHPLHTEVVANIKGRDEIIALLGELGVLYFTFKYLNEKQSKYLIYSFSAFLLGILSKEGVITFIAIVPLTAYFFTQANRSDIIKVTAPTLLGTFVYLMMRINAIGYLLDSKEVTEVMNNPFFGMSFADKMATIFYTLLVYLKLLIFPNPLTHDYYPYQIPKMTWSQWQPILSFVLHVVLGALILRGWRQRRVEAYLAAFYLVTLSIVSNIFISVGTFMNERFVYHASLAFCIGLAYFLIKNPIFNDKNKQIIAAAVASVFIVFFSFLTLKRIPDWRNNDTLNASAIKTSPNSARANCFYGVTIWENAFMKLPKDASNEQKKVVLDSLKPYFERSLSILPNYGSALKMWVGISGEYYKIDNNLETLIQEFRRANLNGLYEPFVLEFLEYVNGRIVNKEDADKMIQFYTEMIDFYKKTQAKTILPGKYELYLKQMQERRARLN